MSDPLSFQEIRDLVDQGDFSKFHRTEEMQKQFDLHLHRIKKSNKSIIEYINKNILPKDNKPVIRFNSFPYNIFKYLNHHILWDKTGSLKTWEDIRNFVKKKMLNTNDIDKVIIFENPDETKSVRGIPHYHIISEKVTFK